MKSSSSTVLLLLIVVSVLLPITSWMLSAFGYNVHSLLSDEGLRWLFQHAVSNFFSPHTCRMLFFLSALAGTKAVCEHKPFNTFVALNVLIGVLMSLAITLWLATSYGSPLLNVVGGVWPHSPLLDGLPTMISLAVWAWCLIYAYLTRQIQSVVDFTNILCTLFHRYAEWIVCISFLSYNIHLILYIL